MNAETLDYLRDAGPFDVAGPFGPQWEVLAANNDIVATCDDADVAYYVAETLNAAFEIESKSKSEILGDAPGAGQRRASRRHTRWPTPTRSPQGQPKRKVQQ